MDRFVSKPRRRYSEEEIERGLTVVALFGGNSRRACKVLEERSHSIPRATLESWKSLHADRYQEIRDRHLPVIRARIAEEAEDIARELAALERKAIQQLDEKMSDMRPAEIGSTLRNITTSKGINVDKANVIRELPTEIVEHRKTSDDILDELKREGIVVDANVVSEESANDPPELPPRRSGTSTGVLVP